MMFRNFARIAAATLTCALLTVAGARAEEIKVVTSATFKTCLSGISRGI
jgi:hypothetical protein